MTKKIKKLVEDNKDLDSALSALDKALDLSKLEGYSKDAIERAAKSIQYTIKGELGCNYYTYGFHKDDLIKLSKQEFDSKMATINYKSDSRMKDVDYDGEETTYYENGFKLYKDCLDKVDNIKNNLNAEIDRITKNYKDIKLKLGEASDDLSQVKVAGLSVNKKYSDYINKIDDIVKKFERISEMISK